MRFIYCRHSRDDNVIVQVDVAIDIISMTAHSKTPTVDNISGGGAWARERAYGPSPEQPRMAQRDKPRSDASARTSAGGEHIVRLVNQLKRTSGPSLGQNIYSGMAHLDNLPWSSFFCKNHHTKSIVVLRRLVVLRITIPVQTLTTEP